MKRWTRKETKEEVNIEDTIVIYTDGSIRKTKDRVRRGGYGVIVAKKSGIRFYKFPILGLSSSYIELYAIINTMKILLKDGYQDKYIVLNTDFIAVRDGLHNRIFDVDKDDFNYKMRYFWKQFGELYDQFSNLHIRWVSRNKGDAFNEMADALAGQAAEIDSIPSINSYHNPLGNGNLFTVRKEPIIEEKDYSILFIHGGKHYESYETVKNKIDEYRATLPSHVELAILTTNSPGAEGLAEFYAQENDLVVIRSIYSVVKYPLTFLTDVMDYYPIDKTMFFLDDKALEDKKYQDMIRQNNIEVVDYPSD